MKHSWKACAVAAYTLGVLAVAYEIARWTARREIVRAKQSHPPQEPQPQHEAWTLVKRAEES